MRPKAKIKIAVTNPKTLFWKWGVLNILSFLLLFCTIDSYAQSIDPKFQSVFIYGIARKVEWTNNANVFRIGIVGKNKSLLNELKKLASTKKINDKPVQIEELSTSTSKFNQDIIFMAGSSKSQLGAILANASKGTLIMTAYIGALNNDSHVNFILKGNKISFELNKSKINGTNLKISDGLVQLASLVK